MKEFGGINIQHNQSSPRQTVAWEVRWLETTSHMSQELQPWNCESLKEVSKDRPKTPLKSCSVVTGPQAQCEVICEWIVNQILFQWISIHMEPPTWRNMINQ